MSLVGEIEALKASLLSDFEAQKAELKAEITELKTKLGVPDPVEETEEDKRLREEAEQDYLNRRSPGEIEEARLREERKKYQAPRVIDLEATYHPQEIGQTVNGRWQPDGRTIHFTRKSDSQFYRFHFKRDGGEIELPEQFNCDWTSWSDAMRAIQTWLNPQGLTTKTRPVHKDPEDINYLFGSLEGSENFTVRGA